MSVALPAGGVALARPLAGSRTSALLRLGILLIAVAVVFQAGLRYTYLGLVGSFDPTSPLVFVPFVPLAAAAVAATRWHGRPDEPRSLPQRHADLIIAAFFLLLALVTAIEAPRVLSTETLAWRGDLLPLAPFVAGMTALLFGSRVLFRVRAAVTLLTAVSPALYRPAITAARSVVDQVTVHALAWLDALMPFARVDLAGAAGAYVTVPTPQGPFTVAVSEACAGGGAVLGGGLLAATVWLVTEAPLRRKLAWSLLAVVGCWVGNLLRLGVLFGVGAKAGPDAMLGPVHTWLGGIVLALTLAVALATTGRLGLSFHVTRTHPEPLACLTRIDRAGTLLGVAALAVLAVPVADATTHFDFLAGASRLPAASAMATVPRIDGVQSLAPVAWAPAFFGSGSEWERWLVFAPGDPSGRPVGIDVVRSTEPSRFDQYGLAACYGFHGYTILEQGTTSLPGGRIGERIVYRDPDSREIVTVLSWRQYVSRDELERVVVQRRSANGGEPDKASVRAVATRLLTSGGAA